MTASRRADRLVIKASLAYFRWLLKRDFKKGDFMGAKGRWFDAVAAYRKGARNG